MPGKTMYRYYFYNLNVLVVMNAVKGLHPLPFFITINFKAVTNQNVEEPVLFVEIL